jgi:CBS domain-containing protein
LKVRDLMTTQVFTAREETPVHEVAGLMVEHAISGVPVLDGAGKMVGLISERELVLRSTRLEPPPFLPVLDARIPLETPAHYRKRIQHIIGTRAADVMVEEFSTIAPDAEIEDLAALMTQPGVNPVAVIEEGVLVGIVSRTDIVRMMMHPPAGDAPA